MAIVVATGDLCTVEEARTWCLRDPTDDHLDPLWQLLIPGCSQACAMWACRQFTPEDDAVHTFGVPPHDEFEQVIVSLTPWELRVVAGCTIAGEEVLYELGPVTVEGTYRAITVSAAEGEIVELTGDWGMLEVPPLARQACLLTIDAYYQNTAGHSSESLGGHNFSETAFTPGGLPEAARSMLNSFRGVSLA